MNSKEALKELKENAQEICEWELDRLNIIEKDLEVLEIIKRKFLVTTNFVSFIIYNNDEEYKKIIQWIINDANKNKSINVKY